MAIERDTILKDMMRHHRGTNRMWKKLHDRHMGEWRSHLMTMTHNQKRMFKYFAWERLNDDFVIYNSLVLDFVL